MIGKKLAMTLGLVLLSCGAHATAITYDVRNLAGNTFEYRYEVTNDTLGVPLQNFAVLFDAGLYANIVSTAAPMGWDVLALQPDLGLPDAGRYDALALPGNAVGVGATLAGFAVTFDFLGLGTPGAQAFQVLDPELFSVLDTGLTQARSAAPMQVPEPGALALFMLAIAGLCARQLASRWRAGSRACDA